MKTKIVVDSSSNLYALPGVDFACVPLNGNSSALT